MAVSGGHVSVGLLTYDEALAALQLVCDLDLGAGRALHELDIGDLVADLDESGSRGME